MSTDLLNSDLSLRDRNKLEKLIRIKAAAKELFSEKGFDKTTTREIAKKAGVGLSTLFLYATDKRDLLFLAYNDDLEKLTDDAFSDCSEEHLLIDRLCICFRYFYIYYAHNPQVSRDLLRELTFYNKGMQSERFQKNRFKNIRLIEGLVFSTLTSKDDKLPIDSLVVAETIFYIFASHLRKWLASDELKPEAGVRGLSEHLKIIISGLENLQA